MALNLEIDQTFIAAAVSEEQNSDKINLAARIHRTIMTLPLMGD